MSVMEKKLCLVIGNCQGYHIAHDLMALNHDFKTHYDVKFYANWQMIQKKDSIPCKDLNKADVLIYQPLSKVHGCYTTDKNEPNNILQHVSPECVTISFPRLYNNAIWPIFHKDYYRSFMYGMDGIRKYKENGMGLNSMLELYDYGHFDFMFSERWNHNMEISKQKELETEVKVVDFISQNSNKELFLTQDHPTTCVLIHVGNQLLEHLDLDPISLDHPFLHDDNICGLPDSVYGRNDKRYPKSLYSVRHYDFDANPSDDAFKFYRGNLMDAYARV